MIEEGGEGLRGGVATLDKVVSSLLYSSTNKMYMLKNKADVQSPTYKII